MQSNFKSIILFNIYFQCLDSTSEYRDEICYYIGYIENILSSVVYDDIVTIGDSNFSVVDNNVGFQLLLSLLQTNNMLPCDDLINSGDNCTYVNSALGHSSCIHHCFLSPSL